ncbi:MAG: hypothetical protein ACFFC7_34035 [Candidatus Hermodarchaeota archaeon]
MLLPDELELLIALQDNPLGTYKELAKALEVTPPTAKARLQKISEKLDPKSDPNIPTILVQADLDLQALGLEFINVLVRTTSLKHILLLEKAFYQHPHTAYHVRCMGKNQGLFLQFRLPTGTFPKIQEFFSIIQQEMPDLVEGIHFLPARELSVYTKFNLEIWDEEEKTWKFNWKEWISKIDMMPSEFDVSSDSDLILDHLTSLDLQILQELTWNARRKNIDLIKVLSTEYRQNDNTDKGSIEPYQMTRRLQYLNENAILGYRVEPNWKVFNIFDSLLFFCRTTEDLAYKWANLLKIYPVPFKSTFQIIKEGFFWYIACSSAQFSEINELIWEYAPDFDFYLLDYRSSAVYPIWWEIFDEKSKTWRTDDEFMINRPLDEWKKKELHNHK